MSSQNGEQKQDSQVEVISPWNKLTVSKEQIQNCIDNIEGFIPSLVWNLMVPPVSAIPLPESKYAWGSIIEGNTLSAIKAGFEAKYPGGNFDEYIQYCTDHKIYEIGEDERVTIEPEFNASDEHEYKISTAEYAGEISLEDWATNYQEYNALPKTIVSKNMDWVKNAVPSYAQFIEVPYVNYDGGEELEIIVNHELKKNYVYRFNTFIHFNLPKKMVAIITPKTLPANVVCLDGDDATQIALYALGNGEVVEKLVYEVRFAMLGPQHEVVFNENGNLSKVSLTGLYDPLKGIYKIKVRSAKMLAGVDDEEHLMGVRAETDKNMIVFPRKRVNPVGIFAGVGGFLKQKVNKRMKKSKGVVGGPMFNMCSIGGIIRPKNKMKKSGKMVGAFSKRGLNSNIVIDGYTHYVKLIRSQSKVEKLREFLEKATSATPQAVIDKAKTNLANYELLAKEAEEKIMMTDVELEDVEFSGCYETMGPVKFVPPPIKG